MAEANAVIAVRSLACSVCEPSSEPGIATAQGPDEQRARNTVGGTLDTKHPGCSCEELQLLCLPHVQYSIEEMDALYPPFIAPPAVDAGDPHNDDHGTLLHEGYRLAKEIAHDASVQGRRRQMR